MANLAAVLGLLQLNAEVIYMILTKRRNLWEKEQAVAKAKAETRDWFEAWQKDPEQATPPPWARNGAERD